MFIGICVFADSYCNEFAAGGDTSRLPLSMPAPVTILEKFVVVLK
jgi:hypothetical protein